MQVKVKTLIVITALISTISVACATTKSSSHLRFLTREITALKQHLFSNKHKSEALQKQLQTIESAIGTVSTKLNHTNHSLYTQQHLLRQNQQKQNSYQVKLNQQKLLLEKQTYALYLLGRQPYLKILLNQEDPIKMSRYLHYYHALTDARTQLIKNILNTKQQLQANATLIGTQKQKLTTTLLQQKSEKTKIDRERASRRALLSKTNQAIKTQQAKLNRLIENKKALEDVINHAKITQAIQYPAGTNFDTMRHHLMWPLAMHHLLERFNAPIEGGRLHTTGILLKANMGESVRAIFPGTVVFADWLNGFGLLVIIQHGQHYMSLYGRNESLYVKKGDAVTAGEIIATAGNSGGFNNPALYFEIRHNGKPENPQIWLG